VKGEFSSFGRFRQTAGTTIIEKSISVLKRAFLSAALSSVVDI